METNIIRLTHGWDQQSLAVFLSSINPWLVLGVVLALVATSGLAYRVRFWWREGRKLVNEPGHITPRAPIFARIARYTLMSIVRRRYCGPTKVIGAQYMRDPRRLMILVNHQTERDAIAIPPSLRLRVVRALMAVTQITGIRVPLASWLGIIAVHHDSNPAASLRGMIKVLQQDEDSDAIIFPQGALHRDNDLKREEFFDGAMMIAKKTAEKSKRPLAVIPAAIAYDRDPAHATWVQRFFEALGWKKFRSFYGETVYGACIAYGAPIPVESLPPKYPAAMTVIFDEIVKLSAQAEAALKRPTKA
jgi:1-acyl-sn-glycerol-3-phosphate acyltransferase